MYVFPVSVFSLMIYYYGGGFFFKYIIRFKFEIFFFFFILYTYSPILRKRSTTCKIALAQYTCSRYIKMLQTRLQTEKDSGIVVVFSREDKKKKKISSFHFLEYMPYQMRKGKRKKEKKKFIISIKIKSWILVLLGIEPVPYIHKLYNYCDYNWKFLIFPLELV